jgi:hypothetical protein
MTWGELAAAIAKMTPEQRLDTVCIHDSYMDDYAEPELAITSEGDNNKLSELLSPNQFYLTI